MYKIKYFLLLLAVIHQVATQLPANHVHSDIKLCL